jgi:hypothetical protein
MEEETKENRWEVPQPQPKPQPFLYAVQRSKVCGVELVSTKQETSHSVTELKMPHR